MSDQIFQDAVEKMDAANAADPNVTQTDGGPQPDALIYARAMTATLNKLYPSASESLSLAVRAQHIERWQLPRDTYPQGRAGYHEWRNELKTRHAQTAKEILLSCGYDDETIARVQSLITKTNLTTDEDAQALEDVACIVFFEHHAEKFATKHPPEKVARIVKKTWNKMSPHAHTHAAQLDLSPALKTILEPLMTPAQSSSKSP